MTVLNRSLSLKSPTLTQNQLPCHCKWTSVGKEWVSSCFWVLHLTLQNEVLYSKDESFKWTQTLSCRVRYVILKEHYFCKDSKNIFPAASLLSALAVWTWIPSCLWHGQNRNLKISFLKMWLSKCVDMMLLQCISSLYRINFAADQDWSRAALCEE